ncbi:hypothetical protein ACJ2A9_02295 [Anaerobacillus sp. MEB173]|uniref:hypothetical protein n=1 Tax=Anaerobacillus sp. MEB173 TaxID=3383345 RepID=UPI003F8FE777
MNLLTYLLVAVLGILFFICFKGKGKVGCCSSSHSKHDQSKQIQELAKQINDLEKQSQDLHKEIYKSNN